MKNLKFYFTTFESALGFCDAINEMLSSLELSKPIEYRTLKSDDQMSVVRIEEEISMNVVNELIIEYSGFMRREGIAIAHETKREVEQLMKLA